MQIYFDTSALAKRYIREKGSEQVLELCSQAQTIYVSILYLPEMFSTLNRLRREKVIKNAHYDDIKQRILADFEDFSVVETSANILKRSISLLETHPLKALDAIHLACALEIHAQLFVSSDLKQIKAGLKSKLKVQRI